jgi:hypothetical protein
MGGKLAGWLGGWQDENKATLSAHPSSLWDRIGFSSGPSVAIFGYFETFFRKIRLYTA